MGCPELLDIERFASGALDDESRRSIETHLSTCGECASIAADVAENLRVADPIRSAMLDRRSATGESRSLGATGNTPLPQTIGRYEIEREIGRGGMGVVYEARQHDPPRPVAVKVISRTSVLDDYYDKLFRREAAALARLRHPNIAAIYEAGRTSDGRSYFAMELVGGRTLVAYAKHEQLSLDGRLQLFRKVCLAIAYAHQRGVIHRDLKPSNVIVESDGEPKVLDFGLAKIVEADADGSSVSIATEPGRVFGTLPYMSPEQVRGDARDVDVRSDVYSLGVMLYELVTGTLPYDVPRHNLPEAARIICEQSPVAASAQCREARGDLDTIILKALDKAPERRYASVSSLAEDLSRLLNDEPILARPPTLGYQLQKLVRRHRLPVAFAASLLLLIFAFGVVATVMAVKLDRARQSALEARDAASLAQSDAERQAQIAEAVNRFLTDVLIAPDPWSNPGDRGAASDTSILQALRNASDKIGPTLGDQPLVEAAVRATLGSTYRNLGLLDEAGQQIERSLSVRRDLLGDRHPDTLHSLRLRAILFNLKGQYDDAERAFREAIDLHTSALGPDHEDTLNCRAGLVQVLSESQSAAEAEPLARALLDDRRRVLGDDHEDTLDSLSMLAGVLNGERRFAEAEPLYRQVMQARRRNLGERHPASIEATSSLANILTLMGRNDEAAKLASQALETARSALGPDHHYTAICTIVAARIAGAQGHFDEAESRYRDVLDSYERTLRPHHPTTLTAMHELGTILHRDNKLAEAADVLREALAGRRLELGDDNPLTLSTMDWMAATLQRLGADEAGAMMAELVERRRRVNGLDDPITLDSIERLATRYYLGQRYEDAAALFGESLEYRRRTQGDTHLQTLTCMNNLGAAYLKLDRVPDAERVMTEAVRGARSTLTDADWHSGVYLRRLGECQMKLGQYDDAEQTLLDARAILEKTLGAKHKTTIESIRNLADVYDAAGRDADAARVHAELSAETAATNQPE